MKHFGDEFRRRQCELAIICQERYQSSRIINRNLPIAKRQQFSLESSNRSNLTSWHPSLRRRFRHALSSSTPVKSPYPDLPRNLSTFSPLPPMLVYTPSCIHPKFDDFSFSHQFHCHRILDHSARCSLTVRGFIGIFKTEYAVRPPSNSMTALYISSRAAV